MIVDRKDQKQPLGHYIFRAETTRQVFDALTKGVSLINSYFIISSLSLFYFGLYQLVLSLISVVRGFGINFFDGLVTLDMRRHFNVSKPELAKKLFKENIILKLVSATVMTVIIFFGASIIAGWYGKDIANLIKWGSILLIVGSFQSLTAIFLQSVISFSQQGLSAFREFLKLGLIVGCLIFYTFGVNEVVIIHIIAEAASTIVFSIFVFFKKYKIAFRGIAEASEPVMAPLVKANGLRILAVFGIKEVLQDAAPWLVAFFLNTEAVAIYFLSVNLLAFIQDFIPLSGIKPILALKADNLQELVFLFGRSIKYTFWIGVVFFVGAFILVPVALTLLFPEYIPAIPVFRVMIIVLPLYGVMKVLHITLASLREYNILAMRLVNEVAILFIGSAILLPLVGPIGIGVVYLLRLIERTWFLYTRLVRKYPDFRLKLRKIFRIDRTDRQFFGQMLSQFRAVLPFTKKS